MASITLKNLPRELHQALKKRARQHGRSLNREVVRCLEAAVAVAPIEAEEILEGVDRVRRSDDVTLDENLLVRALAEGRP